MAATIRIHRRHLLLLLSRKADTHFTIPQRVEGWVDSGRCFHAVCEIIDLRIFTSDESVTNSEKKVRYISEGIRPLTKF